jgi:hypothetical protein
VAQPGPHVLLEPRVHAARQAVHEVAGVLDGVGAVFVAHGLAVVDAIGTRAVLSDGDGVDVPLSPRGPPDLPVRQWAPARIARAMALVE